MTLGDLFPGGLLDVHRIVLRALALGIWSNVGMGPWRAPGSRVRHSRARRTLLESARRQRAAYAKRERRRLKRLRASS